MEFHDYLRLLHAQHSVGLSTSGTQYMELCMSLHLCLMPSAADRRSFGALLAKKHSENYSLTVMSRARVFHREAQKLRDKAMSEV